MDTNITIPKKEIAPGIFTTGGVAQIPTQPITPDSLKNEVKIDLSGTTVNPAIDTSIIANATENAKAFDTQAEYQRQLDLQKQTKPDQTPLNDILAGLTTAEQGLTGRGAEQISAEASAGLPEAQKQRATLQGQIKSGLAEYNALKTEFEKLSADIEAGAGRKGLTTGAVAGQQGAVDRAKLARLNSKASEIGLLQAQDETLAGQIETAQNTVNRAIDLKYQDKEAEYQIKKLQYDRIKESLTAEEKKRGDALQTALKKEETALADAKQREKDIQAIALKVAENGGDSASVTKATSVAEAISLAKNSLMKKNVETKEINGALYAVTTTPDGKVSVKLVAGGGTGNGVSGVSNPQYAGVINTILGSGKFTKDQTTSVKNAINNGEDPLTVIKNQAKNILGQTEGTKITNFEVAKSAMTDLQNNLAQFYANGGETSLLSGNFEKVINKLGEVSDPKLVDLATQIQAQLQIYRNAVSGTAYSVQEGKDIASVFPGINKSQGLNEAIISGRMKAFDSVIDGSYRTALGSAYDKLKNVSTQKNTPKGTMSDRDYVEKTLVANNIKYDEFVNTTPQGQIPVIDNSTGQIGYIPYTEFTSSKYTKI